MMPRGVTVAQVPLEHFVMVRIHARQPLDSAFASLMIPIEIGTILVCDEPNGPEQSRRASYFLNV
jgi:hypothetical protein